MSKKLEETYERTLKYIQNYNPDEVLANIKGELLCGERKIEIIEFDFNELSKQSVGNKKSKKRNGFITKTSTILVLTTLLFNLCGCKDIKEPNVGDKESITTEQSLESFEKELYNEAYNKGRNAGNIILANKVNEFNAGINPEETINEDVVCEIDNWIGKEGWEFQFDINPNEVDDAIKYKYFIASALYDALVDSVNGFISLPNTLEEFCSQLGILNCIVIYDENTKQIKYIIKNEKVTDLELLNSLHTLASYYNLENDVARTRN